MKRQTDHQRLQILLQLFIKMPEESAPHEGTWLQWPHEYQHGTTYRDRLDPTWIAITKELVQSEKGSYCGL